MSHVTQHMVERADGQTIAHLETCSSCRSLIESDVDLDVVLSRILDAVEEPFVNGSRRWYGWLRNPWVVVPGTLALAALVFSPLILLGGPNEDNASGPATPLDRPTATTAPTTTILSSSETQPPVETGGTLVGTSNTPLGNLSWYTYDPVFYDWTEAGLPGPYGIQPDRDFWQIWSDTHSGLEVFETDAGYLGLGSTTEPDEPRIMTRLRDLLVRVRGVERNYNVVQWDAARGPVGMEIWDTGVWFTTTNLDYDDFYFFAPEEVWFSKDGSDWSLVSASGLGEGVALQSQPGSVAYFDGTWMVIGWADVDESLGYRASIDGSPAAWMSDDLVTWTRVPFDFPSNGTNTRLTRVVAGDRGWLIVASSRYDGDRPATAASLWVSADGLTWEELRIEDITELPPCPDAWTLIRVDDIGACHVGASGGPRPTFVPDGIALYVDVPTTSTSTDPFNPFTPTIRWTWTPWLGVWDD